MQVFVTTGKYTPPPGWSTVVVTIGAGGSAPARTVKSPLTTIAPLPSSARLGSYWEGF